MIAFLILTVLGELSILLHNTQPIWSLEPLQIVQVSSLFAFHSLSSTIIKPQGVVSTFTSQQHNFTNSYSCIPYSLFPSSPKYWFSTSRWEVWKEQQVCSEVDDDSLSQTLQQRKEMLSTARSLLSQPIQQGKARLPGVTGRKSKTSGWPGRHERRKIAKIGWFRPPYFFCVLAVIYLLPSGMRDEAMMLLPH